MHLHFTGTITINAPATKVWRVLAHEYDQIGRWASSIPQSHAVTTHPPVGDAKICGRVCSTAIRGVEAVQETFTYYDEASMCFGYAATDGLPAWIMRAENNWAVRVLGPDVCVVEARAELGVRLIPGVVLAPLLKLQMRRGGVGILEELKYFVEHDKLHPRKLKAQAHARPRASARM